MEEEEREETKKKKTPEKQEEHKRRVIPAIAEPRRLKQTIAHGRPVPRKHNIHV